MREGVTSYKIRKIVASKSMQVSKFSVHLVQCLPLALHRLLVGID